MAGPQVGGGKVEIVLDGRPQYLVPSLEAAIELSQIPGGFFGQIQRCNQLDFALICQIVGAGIQINGSKLNPAQREKMLPKAIYEAGVVGVAARCVQFLTLIMNGGREIADDDETEEGAGEDGEAPLGSAT